MQCFAFHSSKRISIYGHIIHLTYGTSISLLDGNCCEYGGGASWVVDLNTGNDVWRSDGQYGAYIEVDIEIDARGFASVARETPHYQPGSWPELEQSAMRPDNAEQGWPGAMPSQNTNSLAINVQLVSLMEKCQPYQRIRFNANQLTYATLLQ